MNVIEERGGGGRHGVGQGAPVAAEARQPFAGDGDTCGDGLQAALGAAAQDEAGHEGDEEQPAQRGDPAVATEGAHGEDGEGAKEEDEVDVAQAAAACVLLGVLGLGAGQAGGVEGGGVERRLVHKE